MNPLVIDLLEVLLRKGVKVTTSISSMGNNYDLEISELREAIRPGGVDGWIVTGTYDDGFIVNDQDVFFSNDSVEMLKLEKFGDKFHLF